MTIVTPIDGQPAQAEHVAQLTESLTGVRAEPITLRGDLARTGADLSNRLIKWQTNGADRWRMGIIDTQAEGAPDTGGDFKFQYVWNSGTAYDLYRIDRDVGALVFNAQNSGVVFEANGTTYPLIVRSQGDTWPAFQVQYDGRLEWGTGGATTDTYLGRSGAGTLQVGATLFPGNTATNDLGTTTSRWRKLWAAAGEFTATPTVGGVALPTAAGMASTYLPLAGGALTGNLGVGVTPVAWVSPYVTTQVGVMALYGQPAAVGVGVRANSYYDGTNNRAIITGAATDVSLANGTFNVYTAPSVAAGATQTMTQRIGLAQTGTLALTPAASTAAISIGGTAQPKISVQSGAPSSPMTGDLWVW